MGKTAEDEYDVLRSSVKIGRTGVDAFYHMQLAQDSIQNSYIVLTNRGRVVATKQCSEKIHFGRIECLGRK
jgi:hypothetical protein